MSKPSIYAVGGTVQASGGVYLPRVADSTLLQLCLRGTYVHILTTRQVGKSSLMIRTVEQLGDRGVRTVVIDISSIGVDLTEEQWYFSLLKAIKDQLALEINLLTWWQANAHINEPARFTTFLKEVVLQESSRRVVIFIDEIDTTRVLRFTDDFFIAVRSLYNERSQEPELERLSFVLIGVASSPQDLIKDAKRTSYNIGTAVELTDFTFEEALPLAGGLGLPEAHSAEVLEWVLKWTSGHPYLTQRICHDIAQAAGNGWTEQRVDELVTGTFSEDKNLLDSNLHFVRTMLTTQAPDAEKVLKTYRKVRRGAPPVLDEERSQTKCHLKLSGVVRRQGRTLRMRNRIYSHLFDERWVAEHIPVNWPKRLQRTAMALVALLLLITLPVAVIAVNYAARLEVAYANLEKSLTKEKEATERAVKINEELEKALEEVKSKNRELDDAKDKAEGEAKHAEASEALAQVKAQEAEAAKAGAMAAAGKQAVLSWEANVAGSLQAIGRSARELDSNKAQRALTYLAEANRRLKDAELVKHAAKRGGTYKPEQRSVFNSVLGFLYAKAMPSLEAQFASIGHRKDVNYAAFSPDGNSVVTVGKDMMAKLWDLSKGEDRLIELCGHEEQLRHAAFSPDGRTLVTGGDDGTARFWDARDGKPGRVIHHSPEGSTPTPIYYVNYSHDGTRVLTAGGDGNVKVWGAETGALEKSFQGYAGPVSLAEFSPTGKYILAVGEDGLARVWNTQSGGEKILSSNPAGVRARDEEASADASYATFDPDGRYVVTAHGDGIVRVWEAGAGGWESAADEPVRELHGHDAAVLYVAFSHGGDYLVTTDIAGKAMIWDAADTAGKRWQVLQQLVGSPERGHAGPVLRAAFSSNDDYVVTAGVDMSAQVWDVTSGNLLASLHGHRAPVNSVAFGPAGAGAEFVLTSSNDGTAKVWHWKDAINASVTLGRQSYPAVSISFSPDGRRAITTEKDAAVVWDVQTRKRTATLNSHRSRVFYAAFSHDGKRVVTASEDETAIVWDRAAGEVGEVTAEKYVVSMRLLGHEHHVHHAEFSKDDKLIITASDDRTAIIWDADSGLPRKFLKGHARRVTSGSFSASGKFAVTTSADGSARVWDVKSGRMLKELEGHLGIVYAAAFSPTRPGAQGGGEDRWIATAGEDGTVRIWDWQKADEPWVLEGHVGKVYSVAFNHDGALLLSAGEDGSAIVFDATSGDVLSRLKPGTGGLLSASLSRDGRRVATVSRDGSLTLWDFPYVAEEVQAAEQDWVNKTVKELVLYHIDGSGLKQHRPGYSLWVNHKLKNKAQATK